MWPGSHLLILPHRRHLFELLLVSEVQSQRSEGDKTILDRPSIRTFLRGLKRNDGEPENLSVHRIFRGDNFAVVVANRLPRPADAAWVFGEVHIDQAKLLLRQNQ